MSAGGLGGGFIGLISRFGLAGLANTAIGFAVIAGLDVGLGVRPAIANAAGYVVGAGLGYALNRMFVFRSREAARATAPRYFLLIAAAFLLNQLVLRLAGHVFGAGVGPHLAAQLLAMATYTATVFVACRYWVFAPRP